MMIQLIALVKKELIQTFRDKRMRFIIFAAPVIQLIIFGYVATTEVKNIKLLFVDREKSLFSRELENALCNSGYFLRYDSGDINKKPSELLDEGKVKVVITIPDGFSKNVVRNERAGISVQIDAVDANAANIIKNYLIQIINNQLEKISNINTGYGRVIFEPEISLKILYNPELKSSHYMVPGILSLILLIITALLTALAITREKELGTIEQILIAPVPRIIFILGKTVPFVLVGFVQVLLILSVAKIIFDVPIRGSLILLFFCATIFLFTTLGLGLFAASVCRTQTQAMFTVFPIVMPALLLSGFFFPINNIPLALRWISYINPLTYFLIIVRGIMLKGNTLFNLYKEIIILIVFGIGFITFSSLKIQKRIK